MTNAELAELEIRVFEEIAKLRTGMVDMESRLSSRMDKLDSRMDRLEEKMDRQFAEIRADMASMFKAQTEYILAQVNVLFEGLEARLTQSS